MDFSPAVQAFFSGLVGMWLNLLKQPGVLALLAFLLVASWVNSRTRRRW